MKLTSKKLKQIIREELGNIMREIDEPVDGAEPEGQQARDIGYGHGVQNEPPMFEDNPEYMNGYRAGYAEGRDSWGD